MNYEANFTLDGAIVWDEAKRAPVNPLRFQKAMFMDRPDLWPTHPKGRRNNTKPLPGQLAFSFFTDSLHQCQGPHCPRKERQ